MKVVPMGWSWAMFFAQRIHQHQVMIGAGISHEQVLVDGRPPPMLDDGKSIVIPYADNLNVIGINKQDVQNIKDKAVARLRQVGFRVHEEEDASATAKALGFIIDGDQLRVHPVPEKRDKVISVLRWLSQRPKVTGKCIERIVGHCIHFFMLKRELLSIFRSVYDFKTAHYSSPSRLWRTAADECRWAADLPKASEIEKNQSRLIFSIDIDFSFFFNRNLKISIEISCLKINRNDDQKSIEILFKNQ